MKAVAPPPQHTHSQPHWEVSNIIMHSVIYLIYFHSFTTNLQHLIVSSKRKISSFCYLTVILEIIASTLTHWYQTESNSNRMSLDFPNHLNPITPYFYMQIKHVLIILTDILLNRFYSRQVNFCWFLPILSFAHSWLSWIISTIQSINIWLKASQIQSVLQ